MVALHEKLKKADPIYFSTLGLVLQFSQFFFNFLNFSSTFSVFPQLSHFFLDFLSFSSTLSIFLLLPILLFFLQHSQFFFNGRKTNALQKTTWSVKGFVDFNHLSLGSSSSGILTWSARAYVFLEMSLSISRGPFVSLQVGALCATLLQVIQFDLGCRGEK